MNLPAKLGRLAKEFCSSCFYYFHPADIKITAEDIIKGLLVNAGNNVTVAGGMAGRSRKFTGTVFTNNVKTNSGLLSLILDEDKIDVKGMAVSGWKAVGTEKKITKCEGSWIYTIDNEPAMNLIKKFLGKEIVSGNTSKGLIPLDINFPIQIQRESGKAMMRPFLLWNTEDQSIMVGGPVKVHCSDFRFPQI